jgi:membrane fusion protein, multidrug efflux system
MSIYNKTGGIVKKNEIKSLVLWLCALCLLLSAMAGCGGEKAKKPGGASIKHSADSAIVTVVVTDIKERPFEDWGSYSADLRGVEDAVLAAPSQGGRVNWVKEVGARVKAGESLCDIDTLKYDAAFEAAKAQVDVAKGDLERATINVEKGMLGRSAIDGANLSYQNARLMLANAKRAFEDCHCQAPFNGVLVSRSVEKFQTVLPGAPTVRLSRIDHLEAVIAIPETEAFSYQDGMRTEFRLLQRPDKVYEGKLSSLDRAVDAHSRTVTATIRVTNSDGSLKPGMVGRASILRHSYQKAIVIPSSALLRLQNGISAMVVENGVARQRTIAVGATTADSSLISEGLREGDKLVVTGAFQVSDGTKVSY